MANQNMTYLAVIGMVALFVVGFLGGAVIHPGTTTSSNNSSYHLTLVITDDNMYNTTVGTQPAFFVLKDGQMFNSSNIVVPVNEKISLTIVNYDDGADTGTPASLSAVVTGTKNNTIMEVTDETVNASSDGNHIELNNAPSFVTSVPTPDMSHTWTVGDANNPLVNIPIIASATVSATIMFSTKGQFTWQCFVPCGADPAGWAGAMSQPGWMTGTVTVA